MQPLGPLVATAFRGAAERCGSCGFSPVAWQPLYPLPSVPMKKDPTPVTKAELKAELDALEARLKRYFDVVVEQLTHNFRGAFSDRVETLHDARLDHERRLQRLEHQLGLSV
jgi:hypothetical protein